MTNSDLDAIRANQEQDAVDRASDDPRVFAAYLRREYATVGRIEMRPGFAWYDMLRAVEMIERMAGCAR